MKPKILKPTQKYIVNLEDRKTGTGQGSAETNNFGVTQKTDNTLKGIWNLVPNETHN